MQLEFTETVQGVHVADAWPEALEHPITLTIIHSLGAYIPYVEGDKTGPPCKTFSEAVSTLEDCVTREFGALRASGSWSRRAARSRTLATMRETTLPPPTLRARTPSESTGGRLVPTTRNSKGRDLEKPSSEAGSAVERSQPQEYGVRSLAVSPHGQVAEDLPTQPVVAASPVARHPVVSRRGRASAGPLPPELGQPESGHARFGRPFAIAIALLLLSGVAVVAWRASDRVIPAAVTSPADIPAPDGDRQNADTAKTGQSEFARDAREASAGSLRTHRKVQEQAADEGAPPGEGPRPRVITLRELLGD